MTTASRPARRVPAWLLPTLQGYDRRWIRLDVVAGIAAGCVVIPQAMAYASLAGLPVEVGLYTCMLPMLVYAMLGGSRSLSISTTSTIAILTATAISAMPGGDAADVASAAFTLAVLVGIVLLLMRLFRLGSLVEQISPATMTGVKTGVGLTVAVSQLPAALGMAKDAQEEGFLRSVGDLLARLDTVSVVTALVSAVALALLLVLRRVAPRVPGPLVVVAGAILLVSLTDVESRGLELIGAVPSGLPGLALPVWGDLLALAPSAMAIALMAFMETVLVARMQRERDDPPIDANRELLANGAAAVVGGLTQTVTPAGGFSQSAINKSAGARSQLAGLTTAILAVLVALLLGPVLELLPQAILSVMVLIAVLGLVQPREFARLSRIDRLEFWVAVVTALLGLTAGLLSAVVAGVVLTLLLVLRALSRSRAEVVSGSPPRTLTIRLAGSLYTGNARPTFDAITVAVEAAQPAPTLVRLDLGAVVQATVPLCDGLRELAESIRGEGGELQITDVRPAVRDVLTGESWFGAVDGEPAPSTSESASDQTE